MIQIYQHEDRFTWTLCGYMRRVEIRPSHVVYTFLFTEWERMDRAASLRRWGGAFRS